MDAILINILNYSINISSRFLLNLWALLNSDVRNQSAFMISHEEFSKLIWTVYNRVSNRRYPDRFILLFCLHVLNLNELIYKYLSLALLVFCVKIMSNMLVQVVLNNKSLADLSAFEDSFLKEILDTIVIDEVVSE